MRHPNYLGEMLFWIGLALIGFAGTNNPYLFAGAAQMVILWRVHKTELIDIELEFFKFWKIKGIPSLFQILKN